MEMAYKPGTGADFEASMAEAIEDVFEHLWQQRFGWELPSETRPLRRMLFVSIAQGVVRHLAENAPDAFDVEVKVTQSDTEPWAGPWIRTAGDIASSYHSHPNAQLSQVAADDNRIRSYGKGKEKVRVNLTTTGPLLPPS